MIFKKKTIEELKNIRRLEAMGLLKRKPTKQLLEREKIMSDIRRIRSARLRKKAVTVRRGAVKAGKIIKGTLKAGGDIMEGVISMFPEPPKKKGKRPKDIFGGF